MNAHNLSITIDRIAALASQIAELEAQRKDLVDSVKALGNGKYFGGAHYLTVATATRATLDMDAIRAALSPEFLAQHTRLVESTTATLRGYHAQAKAA